MVRMERMARRAIEQLYDSLKLGEETRQRLGRPCMGADDEEWYAMKAKVAEEVFAFAKELIHADPSALIRQ